MSTDHQDPKLTSFIIIFSSAYHIFQDFSSCFTIICFLLKAFNNFWTAPCDLLKSGQWHISVCNWPQLVPGCGGPAPVVTDAPVPATEPAPEVTTSLTTPVKEDEDEVTYRPAPGSFYQCEMPGIADDEKNCNKFWLCKEQTEGSGVLEVSRICPIINLKIMMIFSSISNTNVDLLI